MLTTTSPREIQQAESKENYGMNYEFLNDGDFLTIRLSGTAGVNERLSVKEHLAPQLRNSPHKVIVDLGEFNDTGGVYMLGVLNAIKKEFELLDGQVKLCSLKPELLRYFEENRLDQIFDLGQSVEQIKSTFKKGNHDS
jgi:anti-anti-sigma regulatory factor